MSASDLLSHFDELFASGPVSFERFMESALYDPAFGYYTASIKTVGGREADFSTAATLSKNLGTAIGGWVQQQIDQRDFTVVIEIGGGDGSLARQVLKSIGFLKRRKIRYRIVEISPVLRDRQQKILRRKAEWFSTIDEAISDLDSAILFSNELVDAFPVRWLRWNDQWEEIFVSFDRKSGLAETFERVTDLKISDDFPTRPNQRIEIHDSYQHWLDTWMPKLNEAALLTIDYGEKNVREIYERRLAGTLRGYFRQQRIEGGAVYQRFGKQDLTADVNFSDLERWGAAHNFETIQNETQSDFLTRFGIENDPPNEANAAFRVLEQAKRSSTNR